MAFNQGRRASAANKIFLRDKSGVTWYSPAGGALYQFLGAQC